MRAYHNIALERIRCLRAREGVFDAAFRSMSLASERAHAVSLKIEKLEKNQAQSRVQAVPRGWRGREGYSGRYNGIWTNPIELQVAAAYTRLNAHNKLG